MKKIGKKTTAAVTLCALTLGIALPASAAPDLQSSCDETYYATLDYYGGLEEAGVVKSYALNGNTSLTDYGSYDEITNLTDSSLPETGNGSVTFTFGEDAPEHFYFQGKTDKPYRDFPWRLSLSYKLNGVPVKAEDLAGKTGMAEITVDALPNKSASEYSRNNLALVAATALNDSDILSLEAEGAEVQLIGNLRAVIYMVLPGEEQHFTLRVGSDSFAFPGMIFMAVPVTLAQLDMVSDLREVKDKTQDSYDAVSESLDILLATMENMTGSLRSTADGLDELNAARKTAEENRDTLYAAADKAEEGLDGLPGELEKIPGHLDETSETLSVSVAALDALRDETDGLKADLSAVKERVADIQQQTKKLASLLTSLESRTSDATKICKALERDIDELEDNIDTLESALNHCTNAFSAVKPMGKLTAADFLSEDDAKQLEQVLTYRTQYETYLKENNLSASTLSFKDFIVAGAYRQFVAAFTAQAPAGATPPDRNTFLTTPQGQTAAAQAQAAADAYDRLSAEMPMLNTLNGKIDEVNTLLGGITTPAARLTDSLSDLCTPMVGLADDLKDLTKLCRKMIGDINAEKGAGTALLGEADKAGDLVASVSEKAAAVLDRADVLVDTVDSFEPKLQSALTDGKSLTEEMTLAVTGLRDFFQTADDILRTTEPQLNGGTKETLTGLSDTLRKTADGLGQTATVRHAKDTVGDLIDEEWNKMTGEETNILLTDAEAKPESLTSPKNESPKTIQYVMRTKEIKVSEEEKTAEEKPAEEKTTFWQRVATMFRDFWNFITKPFRGK